MTAMEIVEMRRELRLKNVKVRVVKNRLAALAFEEGGYRGLAGFLAGPCAVVTGGEDMPAACKAVTDCARKIKKVSIMGGFSEGRAMDPSAVEKMAQIPPRPVLLAQFIGGIKGVAQRLAGSFQGVAASLGRALEEVRRKKEAAAAAPAPAAEGNASS
jgi:large subunit ribosomal protein L10